MTIIEFLKNNDLFKNLSNSAMQELARQGRVQRIVPGAILFLEGDEGVSFFLVMEGAVKLFKSAPDGREIIVNLMHPGEIFAEVVLFEDDQYPVSAVSIDDSRVMEIKRIPFLKMLDDPGFRSEFIAGLMKKMRYLAGRILYLMAYDVEDRFFRFLLERYGRHENYTITLSKKDIAAAIGTIPETFSRLIQRLKRREVIEWDHHTVKIKDGFWEDSFYDE